MSDYPIEIRLKDGTLVLIRLLRQDDKEELKIGFEKLSAKSKYCRFFVPISSLSNSQLKQLTEMDNKNHLALCAYVVSQDGMFGIRSSHFMHVGLFLFSTARQQGLPLPLSRHRLFI